jgi:hypothetical protein
MEIALAKKKSDISYLDSLPVRGGEGRLIRRIKKAASIAGSRWSL